MLSKKQSDGLPEMMEELGLIPQNEDDQAPFPEGQDRPVAGAVDVVVVTGNHCIYDLATGCGITMPLRDVPGFEEDPFAEFEDDSCVRIFNNLQ